VWRFAWSAITDREGERRRDRIALGEIRVTGGQRDATRHR